MNSQKLKQVAFGLVFLLIGSFLMAYSFLFEIKYTQDFSPYFFPRIILGLWIVLSTLLVIKPFALKAVETIVDMRMTSFYVAVVLVALLLLSFEYLGFIPAGIAFFMAYSWFMGYRKPLPLFILSTLTIVITWYVFQTILEIVLPPFWFDL